MNPTDPKKEVIKKQETGKEAVEGLISKNQAEKASEGMAKVMEQADAIKGNVADVMAGMEAPSEGISERNREDKRGGFTGGMVQASEDDQAAAQVRATLTRRGLPSQVVMIKKIRTAINEQIAEEMKRAKQLKKSLTVGGAQEYNASIAKIRSLKQVLKSLFHSTLEKVKEMYFRYFGEDGNRKVESP